MRLTVIFSNIGAAANVGGPIEYRRVTVDLTSEQAEALALRDPQWESRLAFIEDDDAIAAPAAGGTRNEKA